MIKVGTANAERIKVGNDYVFIVKVGNDITWTTPVRFYLTFPSTMTETAINKAVNVIKSVSSNLLKREDSENPSATSGFLNLIEGTYNNKKCFYCDVYYGDVLKFSSNAIKQLRTLFVLSVAGESYILDMNSSCKEFTDTNNNYYQFKAVTTLSEYNIDVIQEVALKKTQSGGKTFVEASCQIAASAIPLAARLTITSPAGLTAASGITYWDTSADILETRTLTTSRILLSSASESVTTGSINYVIECAVGSTEAAFNSNKVTLLEGSIDLSVM